MTLLTSAGERLGVDKFSELAYGGALAGGM